MNENRSSSFKPHHFTAYAIAVVWSQMTEADFFCVVYMRIILIPTSTLYLRMSSIDHHSRWKKFQIGKEDTAFRDSM